MLEGKIRRVGRSEIVFEYHGKVAAIPGEISLGASPGRSMFVAWPNRLTHWEVPYDDVIIDEAERAEIVQSLVRAASRQNIIMRLEWLQDFPRKIPALGISAWDLIARWGSRAETTNSAVDRCLQTVRNLGAISPYLSKWRGFPTRAGHDDEMSNFAGDAELFTYLRSPEANSAPLAGEFRFALQAVNSPSTQLASITVWSGRTNEPPPNNSFNLSIPAKITETIKDDAHITSLFESIVSAWHPDWASLRLANNVSKSESFSLDVALYVSNHIEPPDELKTWPEGTVEATTIAGGHLLFRRSVRV